jgi:hypothetical protein
MVYRYGDIIIIVYVPTLEVSDMASRGHNRRNAKSERRSRKTTSKQSAPKTAAQFFAMSQRLQDRWISVSNVVSKMRADKVSLTKASGEFGVDPRVVVRLGGSALRKRSNGQYLAKPNDDLLRVLVVPTTSGLSEIAVRDSRQASVLGKYWVAVQKYLETGDASALRKIRSKTVSDADGKRVRLIKDLTELERLGSAGVLSFESLYTKAA